MGFWDMFFGKKGKEATEKPQSEKAGSGRGAGGEQPKPEHLIGEVEGYFRKPEVAVIRIQKGPLCANDEIWIKGHTTDLKCAVRSMQIDHKPVERAEKGQSIGLQVKKRVRRGDKVYRAL